jgi:hypothetical protein
MREKQKVSVLTHTDTHTTKDRKSRQESAKGLGASALCVASLSSPSDKRCKAKGKRYRIHGTTIGMLVPERMPIPEPSKVKERVEEGAPNNQLEEPRGLPLVQDPRQHEICNDGVPTGSKRTPKLGCVSNLTPKSFHCAARD